MRRVLCFAGDSLTMGTRFDSSIYQGGKGAWWELVAEALANIVGVGPLISSGIRGTWLGYAGNSPCEWTFAGVGFTAVASTDAFDVAPYGGTASITGVRYGSTINDISTYTRSARDRANVGFALYWINKTGGGDWQYRIDGGTWTNMGQTLGGATANKLCKFYVNTPFTSTVEVRGYNGSSNVQYLVVGIEKYYLAPSTTQGLICHNIAINGSQLHELVATTSGDRMAFFDAVQLGTGSPDSPTPNAGVINMNINDVTLASSSGWGTDLTTLNTRVSPLGPVGLMNVWECATGTYNQTQQTNYRAQTKTSAAGFSTPAKVLDFYDLWSGNGWTGVSAAASAGLLADSIHETQAGHLDIWPRVYWFIRNQILGLGAVPSSYAVSAKQAAKQYTGKLAAVQYAAGAPVSI